MSGANRLCLTVKGLAAQSVVLHIICQVDLDLRIKRNRGENQNSGPAGKHEGEDQTGQTDCQITGIGVALNGGVSFGLGFVPCDKRTNGCPNDKAIKPSPPRAELGSRSVAT